MQIKIQVFKLFLRYIFTYRLNFNVSSIIKIAVAMTISYPALIVVSFHFPLQPKISTKTYYTCLGQTGEILDQK